MVVRMPVRGNQARSSDVAASAVVHVTQFVQIRPVVDDRNRGESFSGTVNAASPIGDAKGLAVGNHASLDVIAVHVVPADAFIQVEELLRTDPVGVKGRQAVLDASVVVKPTSEARYRVVPID